VWGSVVETEAARPRGAVEYVNDLAAAFDSDGFGGHSIYRVAVSLLGNLPSDIKIGSKVEWMQDGLTAIDGLN